MNEARVKLKQVSVGYRKKPLIRDIDVEIRAGEIVTLIGPNGAGKSTILKTIARQLEEVSGVIYLNEKESRRMRPDEFSRHAAVLLTGKVSPELMTNRDVVESGRYPYTGRMGILTEEDEMIAQNAMQTAGVDGIAEQQFLESSDGQKQRVMFARALCQEPEVLILDEPTSYLDIRYQLEMMQILKQLVQDMQITVIMSLHEIDLAQKVSDRIICVSNGAVFGIGTPRDMITDERIRRLYGIETGGYDALLGSVELTAPHKTPEVMVLSAGGSGIPVYRELIRKNIPFSAGILYENDIDFHVARQMNAEVIGERPFTAISDETLRLALRKVGEVSRVILTEFPIGEQNQRIREVTAEAEKQRKLVTWEEDSSF